MTQVQISSAFRHDLRELINKHSIENGSNTPDFILSDFLVEQVSMWNKFITRRERWFGRPDPTNHNPFTNGELASER